jgi:two-component system, OmpR family, KDP operon response regulator KdpE
MADPTPLVLVVEDDAQVRRFLRVSLESHGFRYVEAVTVADALREAATRNPAVILLDLGLPDQDGLVFLQQLRGWSAIPVIVISARGREQDKVEALDGGADDYLTKPFGVPELLARVRVALRHEARAEASEAGGTFTAGDLVVDLAFRRVRVHGEEVHLTPNEYQLLAVLIRYAGRVVTHRQLLKEAWGAAYVGQTQYLRVFVGQLRHKIESDPARPRLLTTEPGVGYRLRVD